MAENRRQHFVPEFYLAGFTLGGSRDELLHVLDQSDGRRWRSRPSELAHQRDFYRIDVEGIDPNVFEKTFGAFESQVAALLRQLFETGSLPVAEAYANLMFFLALMAVRIPRRRAKMTQEMDQIMKSMLRMSVATPEHWESAQRRMRLDGLTELAETSYEEAKALFERDDFTIQMPATWHVGMLYESAKTIFPYLADRAWSFFQCEDDDPDFVCSDHPLSLVWSTEGSGFYPPGFALAETEVSLPLSRRWAMMGRFEGEGGLYRATPKTVAAINSRTGMYAGQLYSAREEFILTKRDGEIGSSADLLAWIAEIKGVAPPDFNF